MLYGREIIADLAFGFRPLVLKQSLQSEDQRPKAKDQISKAVETTNDDGYKIKRRAGRS
jgi:hypothetical protein